jgi:signal transduction histidine kinase
MNTEDLPSRRILLAGNPPDFQALLAPLRQHGYEVRIVENGIAALALLRQGAADVTLLDLLLPELDGLRVLKETRSLTTRVPTILFTSFGGVKTAVEAMKAGAVDYLLKPLQKGEVLRALETALTPPAGAAGAIRELEAQLRQAQKLASLGRLTSAVAHELNNHMTVMLGYSRLILEHMDRDDPIRESLSEIHKASERSATLTRQLLTFSRKHQPVARSLDLNSIVAGIQSMLQRLVGRDIVVATFLEPNLPRIKADPAQLEQVLLNLALNARDAMPHGGRLTLTTADASPEESPNGRSGKQEPAHHVVLRVSDTGQGMDPATQSQLFRPFFTTKSEGTGLGLVIVREIIQHANGKIRVSSAPGQGTTFSLYLPQLMEDGVQPAETVPGCVVLPHGSETVLLVEDNEEVRLMLCEFLQRHGYTVLEADSSGEALRICEEHKGPLDLLVTDVVLPQMDGPALVHCVHAVRPGIKVLYISGYPATELVHHGMAEPGLPFLQKPFTMEALAMEIREVLRRN